MSLPGQKTGHKPLSARTPALLIEEKLTELAHHGISPQDLHSYLATRQAPTIPLAVFSGKPAPFQALVWYLKEILHYPNRDIAILLGRSPKTIWQTYHVAKQKQVPPVKEGSYDIPLSVFTATSQTIFQQLLNYLITHYGLTYRAIGKLLNRNERTIWTVHNRGDAQ